MTEPLNKKQLYDLVWKRPIMEVAKEYGLSDRGLAKLCERNGIPVPPRGHWAKKKAGQKIVRPPLIILSPKEPDTVLLMKQAVQKQETSQGITESAEPSLPEEIREAIERELLPKHQVQVLKTLTDPHPIVAKWIQQEEHDAEMYRNYGGWRKPEKLSALEKRRRRIISALLKALETRGFKAEADREYRHFIWIKHNWDQVGFAITERIRQYRRELTEEERKDSSRSNQKWTQVSEPTGMLMLRIASEPRGSSYSAKDFNETAEHPLENQLNAIIGGGRGI